MEYTRQITVLQATIILISSIVGVGVLPLAVFGVRAAGSGAPLVTLLGIVIAFVIIAIITLLGIRFPNKSIILYSEDLIGKWLARVGSLFIIAFTSTITALGAREFGEVIVTSVLPGTPLEVTVIVMLLLAMISSRSDMMSFTYIHHLYSPLILFPGIIIVALSLKNADIINLLPIQGNESQHMFNGMMTIAALLQGGFIMTMIIPYMRRPAHAMKATVAGVSISGGLYLMIVIATVAVFGAEEVKMLVWPTLDLAKATSLPANILERLDAAFLAVWVTAVFTSLYSSYYFTVMALGELLRFRDHKLFSPLILPFIFFIAMLPQNLPQLYDIIIRLGRWSSIFTLGYPLTLLMVALIRRKKGA